MANRRRDVLDSTEADMFRTAILDSDTATLHLLHNKRFDIDEVFPFDDFQELQLSPLSFAVKRGAITSVKTLVTLGAKINCTDRDGATPAIWASVKGELEILQYLISKGATVPERWGSDNTPLLTSIVFRSVSVEQVVKYLIDNNFDPNITSEDGVTPLHTASGQQKSSIVQILLTAGANPNAKTESGATPLMRSIGYRIGQLQTLQLLVEFGADINAVDTDGWTPLMYGAVNNDVKVCEWLISKGAKLTIKNNEGQSALAIATKYNKSKTKIYLENL